MTIKETVCGVAAAHGEDFHQRCTEVSPALRLEFLVTDIDIVISLYILR
jgi:hypothetical protein